jgi:hypothetical protein
MGAQARGDSAAHLVVSSYILNYAQTPEFPLALRIHRTNLRADPDALEVSVSGVRGA